MSYAPYPAIDEVGITTALIQGFTRDLRQDLPGLALAAGHESRMGRWFHDDLKWREAGRLKHTVLSMDFPPVQSDSGKLKKRTVEAPIWTKDLEWGGRKARQVEEAGLDTVALAERAEAMAEDLSRFILLGADKEIFGGSQDILGLINHAGIDTTAGGDWTDPTIMNSDLGVAHAALAVKRQGGNVTLLMNQVNRGVLNNFINNQPVRIGQNLPPFISRVLFEEDTAIVAADTAFLINDGRRTNYDVVAPPNEDGLSFGLGNVNLGNAEEDFDRAIGLGGTSMERADQIMRSRTLRFMNILTLKINRDGDSLEGDRSFAQKITYSD
jgi:hypothetical protein